MIKSDKYSNGSFPFPNRDINPDLKKDDYYKAFSEAIYALWLRNNTAWGYDAMDFFNTMRKYADGRQDTMQYRPFVTTSEDDTDTNTTSIFDDNKYTRKAKRSGVDNILWQNLSPSTKILSSLHGMLDKFDFDIYADMIDAESKGLMEFMKWKKFHEAREFQFISDYKRKAGIPVDEPTTFPKTKEELEIFEAREGLKLSIAKSMQKLLRYSFHLSQWDSNIRKKVLDDLITLGYGATRDYFDNEDSKFKVKWIDPARTVIQFSHEQDYNDAEYAGYFTEWTISNIRIKRPDIPEEELQKIAKNYIGRHSENPKTWNEKYSKLDDSTGCYGYDHFKVWVFEALFLDTDFYKRLYYHGVKGRDRIKDIGWDSEINPLTEKQISKGASQSVKKTPIRNWKQCYWIVDTDYVFDCGLVTMSPRPKGSKPKCPIHVEQLLQSSIIYRLRPILDQIAITWLKFQNSMANMVERGYAVNIGKLMGVVLNDKELDPASVINLWKRKGLLPYMDSMNGRYEGGVATPVTPIDGGLGDRIQETQMTFDMLYGKIESEIGLNPLSLGSTPDPNAPVRTSEAALRATANVLKPIMDALFEVKESIAESMALRIQIGLRVDEDIRESYAGVVSPTDIRAMVMAESSAVQYGIMLRARPDDNQRANITRYMELGIQSGLITPPDAMYFSERIDSGADIVEVRQEMAYSMTKEFERKQKEQQDNIDRQNQGLAQIEQMKAQNLQKQTAMDVRADIIKKKADLMSKKELLRLENNYALLQQTLQDMMVEEGLAQPNVPK